MGLGAVDAISVAVETIGLGRGCSLLEGLENVIGKVLGVLNTAADADKVVENTDSLTLISRDTGMSHAAGNFDQTLNTTKTLSESEDLRHLAETLSGSVTTLDAE